MFTRINIFLGKIYGILRPFGRRGIVVIFVVILVQAIMQVASVTSIFPFLALATDLDTVVEMPITQRIMEWLPFLTPDNLLFYAGAATIGVLILSSLINLVSDYMRARFAHYTSLRLSARMLHNYSQRPYTFHLNHNSSNLIKRLQSDTMEFTLAILLPLLEFSARVSTVLLIFITLVVVDPITALVVFSVFGLIYGTILFLLKHRLAQMSRTRNEYVHGRFVSAAQLLHGIKPVIVHQKQGYFLHRFYQSAHSLARLDSIQPLYSSFPRYILETMAFSGIVLVTLLAFSAGRSLTDIIPILGIYAMAGYRMLPAMQLIYASITTLQTRAYVLDELLDDVTEISRKSWNEDGREEDPEPINFAETIELRSIDYAYPGSDLAVLRDINLTIRKSSKVAFVGPTGSGKSTMVDLLLGLLAPTQGKILIDGRTIDEELLPRWRRIIGYVPQDIFLMDDTVRNNIAFGTRAEDIDEAALEKAAQMAQIDDFIKTQMPQGYDTMVGERGVRLSGGQRQRIGLARALYHQPEVLVLDEATSALDNTTEAALMQALDNLPSSITLVMIAHRLSTVKDCDCIFHLKAGRIIGAGTLQELEANSSEFRALAQGAAH